MGRLGSRDWGSGWIWLVVFRFGFWGEGELWVSGRVVGICLGMRGWERMGIGGVGFVGWLESVGRGGCY